MWTLRMNYNKSYTGWRCPMCGGELDTTEHKSECGRDNDQKAARADLYTTDKPGTNASPKDRIFGGNQSKRDQINMK